MPRPANHKTTWKNWLLLTVGLWAFLVPSWALVPGNPTHGAKNRDWDFFGKTAISCLANPFVSLTLASGKVACGYENRVGPNCCGEQDLGLYYNRARYLNTDSGRFWSQDSYEGKSADPASLHKYLYANANPVLIRDPSGREGLLDTAFTGAIIGVMAKTVVVAFKTHMFTQGYDGDLLREYIEAAGYGAAGGAIAGKLLPYFLSWGRSLGPLLGFGRFGAGTAAGALSGAAVASLKEFIDFYCLHEPTTVKDSFGRVWTATRGGIVTGGLFTSLTYTPSGSGSVAEVMYLPGTRQAYVFTPLPILAPEAVPGALSESSGSFIETIIQQGIEDAYDYGEADKTP